MDANHKNDRYYNGKVRYSTNGCIAGYTDKSSNDTMGDGLSGKLIKLIIILMTIASIYVAYTFVF